MSDRATTFDDYWERYVRAHASPVVRRVHFVATSAGLLLAALGLVGGRPGLVLSAPLVAVVPVRIAFGLEGGRAPVAPRPIFAVLSSLEMWRRTLVGTMDAEIERVHRTDPVRPPAAAREGGSVPQPNMVTDHTLH